MSDRYTESSWVEVQREIEEARKSKELTDEKLCDMVTEIRATWWQDGRMVVQVWTQNGWSFFRGSQVFPFSRSNYFRKLTQRYRKAFSKFSGSTELIFENSFKLYIVFLEVSRSMKCQFLRNLGTGGSLKRGAELGQIQPYSTKKNDKQWQILTFYVKKWLKELTNSDM